MTSRLSSSAHWMSSKASSGGSVDRVDDPLGDLVDEQAPRGERVARAAVPAGEDVVAELAEPGRHPHRADEVEDRAERHEQVLRGQVGAARP